MAVYYWDYGTTTGTNDSYQTGSSTATPTSDWRWYYSCPGTNYITHKYLVRSPLAWTDEDLAAFTRLINDETNTGFNVEMIIRGDIRITDPTIDVRTMVEFIPLLKKFAGKQDRYTIDAFFEKHSPIDDRQNE